MAHTITDTEFGAIRVKRVHGAKNVRLRIATDGMLIATLPKRAPLLLVKQLVNSSRLELRSLFTKHVSSSKKLYENNQKVGASHTLTFITDTMNAPKTKLVGQSIIVTIPEILDWDGEPVQTVVREGVTKALRKEANAYLPRRLSHLAETYGFSYVNVRYTNAKSRWGSCSSTGTLSLNIALMQLPMELIDYILLHELCHTREMNHSEQFWGMVEEVCPDYRSFKRQLKHYTPYL